MPISHHLVSAIFLPRVTGYLLATALVLLSALISSDMYLLVLGCLLPVYPFILQKLLLWKFNDSTGVRVSMLADAVVVALISTALGFSLLPVVLLVTLVLVSSMIIGGLPLVSQVMGMTLAASLVFHSMLVKTPVASSLVDAASLAGLVTYFGVIALLVYQETRLLKVVNQRETRLRRNLQQLKNQLRSFVGPQVFHQLDQLAVDNRPRHRKRLTVFFSDIAGFTHLMDTVDEALIADLLGDYFETMNRIAVMHGGTVDKFIGDGMMAFFGDQETRGVVEDAWRCVAMALEMKVAVARLNQRWCRRIPGMRLRVRIGIHTGYCLVGAFGGSERLEYTALGSSVNLASRLEQRAESDEILVSAETCRLLADYLTVNDRGCAVVKGFSRPIQAFAVQALASRQSVQDADREIILLGSGVPERPACSVREGPV